MPSSKTQTTRDRNLLKIFVALPLLVTAIVAALRAVAGSTLGGVGFARAFVLRRAHGCRPAGLDAAFLEKAARHAAQTRGPCVEGAALVTGCTQGLGRAFARGLVERGVPVVLVSRDQTKLEALAGDLQSEFLGASCRNPSARLRRARRGLLRQGRGRHSKGRGPRGQQRLGVRFAT